ncbi:hypothetical protein Tco_1330758, partial [Tanacetum coccineum]
TMAGVNVNTLTMEQYLALSRDKQAPGVVKPEIEGNVNFKIKSQLMREFREDTFSGNKNEDAHDPIDQSRKKMGGQTSPRNYQYVGSPQKSLYPKSSKGKYLYKGLSTMNHQLLDSQGPIPGMTPAQALTAIHTMADHSQNWHDGTTSRNIGSSSSNDGLATLVGCQICEGLHLDKDCPLNKEVKQVEEVRYGDFGRTTPFNRNNRGKFYVGPPGYYTKIDNCPPYGEKRQSLEELLAKHQEESARRSTEIEVWIKKLQENAEINTRNQSVSLKNLETQIGQLTKEIHSNKTLSSSLEQIKIVTVDHETSGLNKLHGVSFISGPESDTPEVLQHQLPPKELNPGSFTLPCMIGKFNFYAMADL